MNKKQMLFAWFLWVGVVSALLLLHHDIGAMFFAIAWAIAIINRDYKPNEFLSSITTILGVIAMCIALRGAVLHWNHHATLYFNLFYAVEHNIGAFVAGWIGIHAADHRAVKAHFHKHNLK